MLVRKICHQWLMIFIRQFIATQGPVDLSYHLFDTTCKFTTYITQKQIYIYELIQRGNQEPMMQQFSFSAGMTYRSDSTRLDSRFPSLTSFLTEDTMFSTSSSGKRSGISPEARRSLISTRNFSSGTWASVMRNTVPRFFSPARTYRFARSLQR